EKLSQDETDKIAIQLNEVLARISTDAEQIVCPAEPWKECPEIQKLDCISVKDKLDEWCVRGKVRVLVDTLLENMNVSPVCKQSYLGLLCQVKGTPEGNPYLFWDIVQSFRCSNGNQDFAKNLAKNLEIKYNSVVKSIKFKNSEMVTKTNDCVYPSCYVVLTVPPSVWCRIKFQPCLNFKEYEPKMGLAVK